MFELDLERRRIRNRNRKGKTLNPAQPAAHLSSQPSPLFPLRPSLFPSLPARGPALHGPRRRPASPTLTQQPVTPRRPARARLPACARSHSLPRLAHTSGSPSSFRNARPRSPARSPAFQTRARTPRALRRPLKYRPRTPPAPSNPSRHPHAALLRHALLRRTARRRCHGHNALPRQRSCRAPPEIRPEPRVHSELACPDSSHDHAGIAPDRRR